MNPANENRTKLYRIRCKSDGRFLATCPTKDSTTVHINHSSNWNDVGIFWKRPETIRKHLFELCRFKVWKYQGLEDPHPMGYTPVTYATPTVHVSTVLEWLDNYEVIGTIITVHGELTMEAKEFASFQPIEGTGFERTVR